MNWWILGTGVGSFAIGAVWGWILHGTRPCELDHAWVPVNVMTLDEIHTKYPSARNVPRENPFDDLFPEDAVVEITLYDREEVSRQVMLKCWPDGTPWAWHKGTKGGINGGPTPMTWDEARKYAARLDEPEPPR